MKINYRAIYLSIESILLYLAKSGFLKNAAKLVGATALSQIVLILASLVLTRIYTPKDFGVLAIFTSLTIQMLVCASLRYEWAIPLPQEEEVATDLLVLCLILNCAIAPLVAIFVILGGHQIAVAVNSPALEPFLWLLPIVILLGGWYQSLSYWTLRKKEFGLLARTKLAQSVWTTGSQIAIGFTTQGPLGLLVGSVLNNVVGTISQALFFWHHSRTELQNLSVSRLVLISRRYFKFAMLTLVSSVIQASGSTAPSLLLAFFYDPKAAGFFALAQRVNSIPTMLVGTSISQVFQAHAAESIRKDPRELKRLFTRTSLLLFVSSLFLSLGLLSSPYFFPIIFGDAWKESGIMVQYMSPMFVGSMTIGPLTLLEWVEKQDWMILWNTIRLILLGLGFWLAHFNNLSSIMAIAILSIITTIMYVVLLIMNIYAINLLIVGQSHQVLADE
ncbi:oligosaccharide flippase family protein [Chamaesiphon sp. OTE_75_metabat_556]|uniref:oligosaccharide flippase family protein n=1 Tax=Chamaesiphon sp. OTE_75_metabat_556 TaxID=2964692 RepID=UPI00286A4E37|nr:oligosaccharide flippase family protein [Chamaesiphon sp. OTE_75_metabat_556]